MDMQTSTNPRDDTIKHLNSFLRGELSAVETYRQALSHLDQSVYRATLEECARSHQQRALLLTQEIRRLGGDPARESGPWGVFAKLVEGGAAMLGEKAAIAALEEGEDHGRNDYRRDIQEMDYETRQFIQTHVLPEQQRTHDTMSSVKKALD
jgi:demethoxyubiquinone hydroxylase (CLK1/Coq7/Cat5 family)